MSFQNRKQQIIKIVAEKGEVSVKDLAEQLDASEVTIRRDLILLADEGLIFRTHGGAMSLSLVNLPMNFAQKSVQNAEQKDFICQLAAREITEGDTIFMDCGSTVFRLCPFIKNKRVRVITNSLPIIYELINSPISINLIGGELDTERQAVHGSIAVEHIRRYNVDKAFLGVDGISLERGLTAKSEKEVEITLAMMRQSKVNYFLTDSTKINQNRYLQFADLQKIDVLVTDAADEIVAPFRSVIPKVINQ